VKIRYRIATAAVGVALLVVLSALPIGGARTYKVLVKWQDNANPSGTTYLLYRAVGACSATSQFSQIAATTKKSYTDLLKPGDYCFRCTAIAKGLPESAPSNLVTVRKADF
jgi:hypothetical protein